MALVPDTPSPAPPTPATTLASRAHRARKTAPPPTVAELATPGKPGRPGHVVTASQQRLVQHWTAVGVSQHKIAGMMGISADTLQKYYRYELDHGEEIANANVAANLYRIACSNAPSAAGAAQYWLNKRSEKFKETPRRLELTGKNGAPVAVASAQLTLDPRKLTADQRDALRDILMAATEDGGDDREDSELFDTAVDPELDADEVAEAKTYAIAADAPGEIGEPDAELDADDPASGFA